MFLYLRIHIAGGCKPQTLPALGICCDLPALGGGGDEGTEQLRTQYASGEILRRAFDQKIRDRGEGRTDSGRMYDYAR